MPELHIMSEKFNIAHSIGFGVVVPISKERLSLMLYKSGLEPDKVFKVVGLDKNLIIVRYIDRETRHLEHTAEHNIK